MILTLLHSCDYQIHLEAEVHLRLPPILYPALLRDHPLDYDFISGGQPDPVSTYLLHWRHMLMSSLLTIQGREVRALG